MLSAPRGCFLLLSSCIAVTIAACMFLNASSFRPKLSNPTRIGTWITHFVGWELTFCATPLPLPGRCAAGLDDIHSFFHFCLSSKNYLPTPIWEKELRLPASAGLTCPEHDRSTRMSSSKCVSCTRVTGGGFLPERCLGCASVEECNEWENESILSCAPAGQRSLVQTPVCVESQFSE